MEIAFLQRCVFITFKNIIKHTWWEIADINLLFAYCKRMQLADYQYIIANFFSPKKIYSFKKTYFIKVFIERNV